MQMPRLESGTAMASAEPAVDLLERWLTALRTNDLSAARIHAQAMQDRAELLVRQPEFRRAACAQWPDLEPADAVEQFTQFLIHATEASGRAVKSM
jgi:hypothetical protein